MVIELKNDFVSAVIDTKGAQLLSLKDRAGKEYVWQRDPQFWSKSSPVLFPAVGNSRNGRTIFEGQWYELPKHGFAKDMEFSVKRQSKEEAVLTIKATDDTKAVYPYDFCFTMTYRVTGDGISIEYQAENEGEKTMYYCLGAHPAFNCPLDEGERFEDYCLEFEKEEDGYSTCYDLNALEFDAESRGYCLNHRAVVPLKYELFDNDAVFFENLKSQKVSLLHSVTKKGVEVAFGDFKTIAFWTPMGKKAPFLCIEPWNGCAIRSDEDDEFTHKKHVQTLKGGEKKQYSLHIRFLMGK